MRAKFFQKYNRKIIICITTAFIGLLSLFYTVSAYAITEIKSQLTPEENVYKQLASKLAVYSVYDVNGLLKLTRIGRDNDGGYVVAEKSMRKADVLLGYGVANDSSFEEDFSKIYSKPAYGFDCGTNNDLIVNKNLFTFVPECIGNANYLYFQKAPLGKITSFDSQINELNLKDKKLLIKMDIEGAEYQAFKQILPKYEELITGIVLEIHFNESLDHAKKAVELFSELSKHFVLVHVHGNNFMTNTFTTELAKGPHPQSA